MITIDSDITWKDFLGSFAVRLGFNRNGYSIEPGHYGLNNPGPEDPVLVTANYKLTFDKLRKNLRGVVCHLLVLDTKGINVWCAAGKGTFGTEELTGRLEKTDLANIVSHRRLLLPQLGAPGVSAHAVQRETGFKVIYGPVESRDISSFLNSGWKKTEEMTQKRFPLVDRLVLTPLELIQSWKVLLPSVFILSIASGFSSGWDNISPGLFFPLVLGVLSGCFLTPSLLPYIPFRAFAAKGGVMGLITVILWSFLVEPDPGNFLSGGGLLIALSSYGAMNFTGASTFTSLSGVKKEMKFAIPFQIALYILSLAGGVYLNLKGGF